MANITNCYPLTDFQRNAREFIEHLNETKEPVLLTVNGKVQAVLVDPATYQEMEDRLERDHLIAAIREGEKDVLEGRVRPAADMLREIKEEYGL
jgi:prevent-host-death family protein